MGNAPRAELTGLIDSKCVILAAAANGLPLEFFARVIWQEIWFKPNAIGPTTRTSHQAQGIAQFMPYPATERGLLNPLDPETALPEAAESLAQLRREFGNLGSPPPSSTVHAVMRAQTLSRSNWCGPLISRLMSRPHLLRRRTDAFISTFHGRIWLARKTHASHPCS